MEWIAILKCPITGKDLRALTPEEINTLNSKIAQGQVWQGDGKAFTEPLQKGLITSDGTYIYPIIKEIVLLLKDLVVVDSKDKIIKDTISDDKKLVKNFYDQKGWHTDEAGNYEDAVIYEDLRDVSKEYLRKCHDRVARFLNPSGTYMLDAASGALQFSDYLQYSANYKYRVCVDFSFQALSEAKRKLGDKGLCILCDMTNMPFKDGVMDGFVSLNTVYHIPKDEQATAIKELYRVLATNGKGVVVYDWYKHSPWMNFWLLPFRGFVFIKNRILDTFGKMTGTKGAERRLYFYAHTPEYFKENLPPYQLKVWRTVSVPFMRYYIHPWLGGKKILDWLYEKEEKSPEVYGLKGEYPMLVFEK
ncbi:MAG: class I SAM-dependent methyltransferase [Puia sp.]|nr:class I SAM-dependent methyltransferase [Puia sp.]